MKIDKGLTKSNSLVAAMTKYIFILKIKDKVLTETKIQKQSWQN